MNPDSIKNSPAFPCEVTSDGNGGLKGIQTGSCSGIEIGLTKREYFAAMAMQGMLSNSATSYGTFDELAQSAIDQADALLAALATE